jgi:hypothetical protein
VLVVVWVPCDGVTMLRYNLGTLWQAHR